MPTPKPSLSVARDPVRRTVLIADDSRVQRRILAASLRRWGYAVLEAQSGTQALAICRAEPVDLVISDWMMPGMTGLELCEAFRALPGDRYGYFILLTSKSGKEEVARGLEIGADDFLSKPVNADELRARLRAGERILGMQEALSATNEDLSAALAETRRLNAALDRDLEEARRLQHALVPERFRRLAQAEITLLLRPSGHIGGDLVGVLPSGPGEIGVYSIDVSGHGIASALIAARLASFLSSPVEGQNVALAETDGAQRLRRPAEVAARLNRLVLRDMATDHYFTLVLAVLEAESGRLSLVQAGHPHPTVERAGGCIEFLGDGGMPIGLFSTAEFPESETILRPGDRLVIGSDGITECTSPNGEQLGELGFSKILHRNRDLRGEAFFEAMVWDLSAHAGDTEIADDISAVMIDYRPDARRAANARSPELPSDRAAF
jgi:sigma-B regulation protein RsbU (phosphoserine phosphatase)